MATKTIITKVDDIDGSPADVSFSFAWQGSKYIIDLSDAHAAEIKADFDKWISVARRDRGGSRTTRAPQSAATAEAKDAPAKRGPKPGRKAAKPAGRRTAKAGGPSASDVRAWANTKGITVATRGRLAPAIIEQFLAETTASE